MERGHVLMYKTAVIILREDDTLTKVFDEQTHMAKLFKNSCIYRLRQSPSAITSLFLTSMQTQ